MLRKKEREIKTKGLTILLEPSGYERLRVEAFKSRCSVGEIVRRALKLYMEARRRERSMAGMHEKLEEVLRHNPGQSYCAGCLAKAAGFTSPQDRLPVRTLMGTTYLGLTDRDIKRGRCDDCGEPDLVVRLK